MDFIPYLPAICSAIASLAGVLISNKLSEYRIAQLEKKVDKHNTLIERMYKVETKLEDLTTDVRNLERKM